MSDSITVDTARLPLLLQELRLPTVAKLWQTFTERADREGWPSARLLATLAEFELAERARRRIQRHLVEARLPPGKTLGSFWARKRFASSRSRKFVSPANGGTPESISTST